LNAYKQNEYENEILIMKIDICDDGSVDNTDDNGVRRKSRGRKRRKGEK
jgi:hypothetical protein